MASTKYFPSIWLGKCGMLAAMEIRITPERRSKLADCSACSKAGCGDYAPMKWLICVVLALLLFGCNSQNTIPEYSSEQNQTQQNVADLYIVDCLLPGQIRNLGRKLTYITARRPIKTTAVDCGIRGGEYVAYDRANYATALSVWLPQAKEGKAEAQTYVGEIYEKGYGLTPDYVLAAKWYEKAAAQGYSRAQINLGYLYEQGLGVNKDLVTALNWYRKASGLEDEDLAFASTIEAAVKSEYEDEIALLRNELARSRADIEVLRKKLQNTEKQHGKDTKKLNLLKNELGKTRDQLTVLKQSNDGSVDPYDLQKREKELRNKEDEFAMQKKIVQQQESDLAKQNTQLEFKLQEAENRTQQLNMQLTEQQLETGQLQTELTAAQTQLQVTNQSLSRLTTDFQTEQQKIEAEKNNLLLLKEQMQNDNNEELEKIKQQLSERDKELVKHQSRIQKLETDNSTITEEKNAIQTSQDKTLTEKNQALNQLSEQLAQQIEEMEKRRILIDQLETEKQEMKKSKDMLEMQKDRDISKKDENIKNLENQLAKRETAQEQQRLKILEQRQEKEKYQQELLNIQIASAEQVIFPPPTIEILEPPITLTRGLPAVTLRSIMTHREITGRVTAEAGLKSLNVNGVKATPNEAGLFNSLIKLVGKETKVNTVAVDNNGNRTTLEFMLLAASKDDYKPEPSPRRTKGNSKVDFGQFHALIIGNQEYNHFPSLDTPVNDVKVVERLLKEKYGFNTTLVLNANRYAILSALNKLREKLTEVDNLVIYYAGHGELDRVNLRGHWLPVDAEYNNTANWISTIEITDILNAMSANHVLVVADSCYSGAMTRSSLARLEPGMSEELRMKWLKVMSRTRSRTVLTSGGLKPVLDSGANGHSIFANAFIEALANNNGILEGQKLFNIVSDQVVEATRETPIKQNPEYAPIRHGGHESGDFFFVTKPL